MAVKARRYYDIERDVRGKIEVIKLVNRLQNHVLGMCDLSATQIQAAHVLLKKCLPDLVYSENHNTNEHVFVRAPAKATDDEWKTYLAQRDKPQEPPARKRVNGSGNGTSH